MTDGDGRLVSRHFPGSSAWCPCSSAGCSVHNGAVKPSCPDRYLDEFTFRFNRRTSRRCGNLFWHPLEYAFSVDPAPLLRLQAVVHAKPRTQHNGRNASCQAGFVEVAQETFTGLERVSVDGGSICKVLVGGGLPCTVDDLKRWLVDYLTPPPQNRDRSKVRVVVK